MMTVPIMTKNHNLVGIMTLQAIAVAEERC